MRKTLGTIAAVATAMSLIGVAWASDDLGVGARGEVQGDTAVSSSITSADEGTSVTVEDDDSTSTSLDDDETTDTSVAGATSETFDDDGEDTTSTTVDDDDHDDDDVSTSTTLDDDDDGAHAGATAALGLHTYVVSGVGQVTIEVLGNGLSLVAVNAPDWTVAIDRAEDDKIEIEFRRGEAEAEFEAELHSNGGLSIEIDGD